MTLSRGFALLENPERGNVVLQPEKPGAARFN